MKRDDRSLFCLDTLVLVAPLIVGTALYGTLVVAEIGVKSLKTLVWGKE